MLLTIVVLKEKVQLQEEALRATTEQQAQSARMGEAVVKLRDEYYMAREELSAPRARRVCITRLRENLARPYGLPRRRFSHASLLAKVRWWPLQKRKRNRCRQLTNCLQGSAHARC